VLHGDVDRFSHGAGSAHRVVERWAVTDVHRATRCEPERRISGAANALFKVLFDQRNGDTRVGVRAKQVGKNRGQRDSSLFENAHERQE
jgi:hypothetical protein